LHELKKRCGIGRALAKKLWTGVKREIANTELGRISINSVA